MKIKRKRWRAARTLFINCGLLFLTWGAVVKSSSGAANILKFYLWLCVVLNALCFAAKEVRLEARRGGRSIPASVSITCGAIIAASTAWVGMFGVAIACVLIELLELMIYEGREE